MPNMSHRQKIVVASIIVGAFVVAVGFGIWYLWFRSDAPPEAALPDREVSGETSGAGEAQIDGTWNVVSDEGEDVFVGYRVSEVLASGLVEQDAVGRTSAVTGTVTITDGTVTEVEIVADVSQLESDQGNRDNYIRGNSLETNTFPEARFVLTEPIDLDGVPEPGEAITVTATGDLTLRDVTQEVQIEIEARWNGSVIDITGSVPVTFADYGISTPSVPVLADIDDHGTMEFQLVLARD